MAIWKGEKNSMNQREQPNKLPNSFITAILVHLFIGWVYLRLSEIAVKPLNYNAFLGLIPAAVFILPFLWFAVDFSRIFPGESLVRIFLKIYGKLIGLIVFFIYAAFLMFIGNFALIQAQQMVLTYFPSGGSFLFVIFILSALYLGSHGPASVGRLASFMLIPPLVVFFGMHLIGLSNINPVNIRPLFTSPPQHWLISGYNLLYVFLPVTAIFEYLPFIRNPKSVLKTGLASIGITLPLFILTVFGTIGTFGPQLISRFAWPEVEFFRVIDLPYLLLEQAGLIFIITWFAFIFVTISHGFFVLPNDLSLLWPKVNRKWFSIGIAMLVLLIIRIPFNVVDLKIFDRYRAYFVASYLSIFFITWLIAMIRFRWNSIYKDRCK
jgi:spore germination protein KB